MIDAKTRAIHLFAEAIEPRPRIKPSEWAEKYVTITDGGREGPIRFDRGYEFQPEILNTFFEDYHPGEKLRKGVVNKGAQSGITTICLIGELFTVIHQRLSAFHLMPREFDANEKAKSIGAFIDASAFMVTQFVDSPERVRKTIHGKVLRVAYSNSQPELKNWSAPIGSFDEVDELEVRQFDSIAMAKYRMGGYPKNKELYIGTPTIPDFGIDRIFQTSDKRYFYSKCPMCGKDQVLSFEENIRWNKNEPTLENQAASAEIFCRFCSIRWDTRMREIANHDGYWKAHNPGALVKGFAMNRLMVPVSIPQVIVASYLEGLLSELKMKEHMNQDRGKTYLPKTGQLNDTTIEAVISDKVAWGRIESGWVVSAGVDVQGENELEYVFEVRAFNREGFCFVVEYGKVQSREDLKLLFGSELAPNSGKYRISGAMIDASNGLHKEACEEVCKEIPGFQCAKFGTFKRTFKRESVEKIESGMVGLHVNEDDALQENLGRFWEDRDRPIRVAVARNPSRVREKEWIDHYKHIVRVRDAHGGMSFRKLRQMGVDYPYAGALAEVSKRRMGSDVPGMGQYGAIPKKTHEESPPPPVGVSTRAGGALKVINRKKRF